MGQFVKIQDKYCSTVISAPVVLMPYLTTNVFTSTSIMEHIGGRHCGLLAENH